MKKFLLYPFFIILIFNCANIFNLLAQESSDSDFLDQLLKEIETMEKSSDGFKTPRYDEDINSPIKSEPLPKYSDKFGEEGSLIQPKAQATPKDTRTLFLDPDVQQIKGRKSTKIRPTKESVDALKHYSDEFNTTAYSVQNKIAISEDFSPQFKETKFTEFKKELELANSMIDIIKDKGIYRAILLKPEKGPGSNKEQSSNAATKTSKNIRQDFLNLLKKLQRLDEELGEPEEEKEPGMAAIQQLARQKTARTLPKYQPLAIKKKTKPAAKQTEPSPSPESALNTAVPETIEPQQESEGQ